MSETARAFGPTPGAKPAGAISLAVGANYQSLIDAAPTGATFWFEPGVHRLTTALDPKDNQKFFGADGAVLNGAQVVTSFSQSGSAWVISGQTQEGVRVATDQDDGSAIRAGHPETVFINNTPLTGVRTMADLKPGSFYFDYAADKIYLADNPSGKTVEVGKAAAAFDSDSRGVTVADLTIEKFNAPVQSGAIDGGQNWTVENNEVRLNYGLGISVQAGSKVIGNSSHDNGQMGLGGAGNNILVEGNEIYKNGFWSGIDVFWEGGGTKFAVGDGLVVRGNYSHDNKGFGLWTDIDVTNALYENNLVMNNSGGGITHEISYGGTIRNNMLIGNGFASQGDGTAGNPNWMWGAQIMLQNSSGVEVYGNKLDMTDSGNGIGMVQQNRGAGKLGTYTANDNHIHDNEIVLRSGNGRSGLAADWNEQGVIDSNTRWVNNKFYMGDGDRWWWGDIEGFAQFKNAAGETGTLATATAAPTFDTSNWSSHVSAGCSRSEEK